jgi:hypothetical protein
MDWRARFRDSIVNIVSGFQINLYLLLTSGLSVSGLKPKFIILLVSSLGQPDTQPPPRNSVVSVNTFQEHNTESIHDVYHITLLYKGHGQPLWFPEPAERHSTNGVDIGDVGLIAYDRRFDFLFNIFHNPSSSPDPLFRPLGIQQQNVIITPHWQSQHAVISTESVQRVPPVSQ